MFDKWTWACLIPAIALGITSVIIGVQPLAGVGVTMSLAAFCWRAGVLMSEGERFSDTGWVLFGLLLLAGVGVATLLFVGD